MLKLNNLLIIVVVTAAITFLFYNSLEQELCEEYLQEIRDTSNPDVDSWWCDEEILLNKKTQFAHSSMEATIEKVGGTSALFVKNATGEVFVFLWTGNQWEEKDCDESSN
jgi:hypothetical protein